MDKKKAIKWLEGYTCARGDDIAEAASLMAHDLGITSEEALKVANECEEKLVELFLEWYNETVDVAAEEDDIIETVELTKEEIFKLGATFGSFSAGEIDQGIHIVLPDTDEDGVVENAVFEPLFTEYFDRIPDDISPEKVNKAYMGAVAIFAEEMQLVKDGNLCAAATFREVIKDA